MEILGRDVVKRDYEWAFFKWLVENKDLCEVLDFVVPFYEQMVRKPQRLLYDDVDYYIAEDVWTRTLYICYRDLMMVDIDYCKTGMDELGILDKLRNDYEGEYFRVYRSGGGLHIFLLSRHVFHKDGVRMMVDLGTDRFYAIFAYIRGYCVRLNRKEKEEECKYVYVCDIGNPATMLIDLDRLCNLHISLVDGFRGAAACLMC